MRAINNNFYLKDNGLSEENIKKLKRAMAIGKAKVKRRVDTTKRRLKSYYLNNYKKKNENSIRNSRHITSI